MIERAQKKSVPQSKSVVPPVQFTSVVASLTGAKPGQQKRNCFHPGVSSLNRDATDLQDKSQVTSTDMLKAMLKYIWPEVNNILLYDYYTLLITYDHCRMIQKYEKELR